jgi:hypothetical protein
MLFLCWFYACFRFVLVRLFHVLLLELQVHAMHAQFFAALITMFFFCLFVCCFEGNLERIGSHHASADEDFHAQQAAVEARRAMAMARVDHTERSREWVARAKTEALTIRQARDAQRRKRDELRQATGLHDSVKSEIAKRAAENERALKAAALVSPSNVTVVRTHVTVVEIRFVQSAHCLND